MFERKKTMQQTEAAMQWIRKAGFTGNLSALAAGIDDITEAVDELDKFMQTLLKIDGADSENALGFFIDLTIEMEHIENHARDVVENLINIRDFFNAKLKASEHTP